MNWAIPGIIQNPSPQMILPDFQCLRGLPSKALPRGAVKQHVFAPLGHLEKPRKGPRIDVVMKEDVDVMIYLLMG